MIKKITLLTLVMLFGMSSYAQKKSKEEVVELMAEDACECIAKKKLKKSCVVLSIGR